MMKDVETLEQWTEWVLESHCVRKEDAVKVAALCKDAYDNEDDHWCIMHMAAEFYNIPCRGWCCNEAEYTKNPPARCPGEMQ